MTEKVNTASFNENTEKEELTSLETFLVQNGSLYSFGEKKHVEMFNHLLQNRLYNKKWLAQAEKVHLLLILQAIRLLTRDNTILQKNDTQQFCNTIFDILNSYISKKTAHHFYEDSETQGLIVELISIGRRLVSGHYLSPEDLDFTLKKIFKDELFTKILRLLDTQHSILLRVSMEFLVFLYDATAEASPQYKEAYIKEFEDIHYLSQILMIIENYQNEYKVLAVNLLAKLVESDKAVNVVKKCFGFTILLNTLNSANDYNLRITILHLIKVLVQNEDNIKELRALGLINLLLLVFKKSKSIFEKILILTSCHLASHEPEASIKLHDLGINILLKALLDVHPMRRNDGDFEDVNEGDIEDLVKNYSLYLFRAIRSIFAVERNRKVIKQVFPPRLFALFVDVGNYVNEVENYTAVYREYVNMPNKEFEALERGIQETSNILNANENTNKFRKVGQYTLIQQLGKGAFGTVYLARKGENEFAVKELKISDFENGGNSSHRRDLSTQAENISKEVRIYKELLHPHIIKYYEAFVEGDYVYIVMEHIDGFNLSDLIKLQAEKGVPFKENQIWTIVISLCGVLKYLHQEKSIIHRDLSPSNILIDRTFRVKLADFGLAKKMTQSASNLKTFVGTLNYTSPEVVENKPYTEKADLWSLGCLIYEMITLKPPFYSQSPLLLAKKIVDNSYEKITNSPYSPKLEDFMTLCLTPDPNKRPGIKDLIQLISEEILDFTHRVLEYEDYLKLQIISLKRKGKEVIEHRMENNEGLKPKLIKIDNQDLVKMKQDPVSNFIEILRKMSIIVSAKELETSSKRDFKKYLIELYYKRVITNPKVPNTTLRQELNKILTFSKEEMSIFKEAEFPLDSTATDQFMMTGGITYEKFYFFIEEKYKIITQN